MLHASVSNKFDKLISLSSELHKKRANALPLPLPLLLPLPLSPTLLLLNRLRHLPHSEAPSSPQPLNACNVAAVAVAVADISSFIGKRFSTDWQQQEQHTRRYTHTHLHTHTLTHTHSHTY